MAVPHVAGLAAVYLSQNQGSSPSDVASAMRTATTPNRLNDSRILPGTANLLLWTRAPIVAGSTVVVAPAVEAQAGAPGASP